MYCVVVASKCFAMDLSPVPSSSKCNSSDFSIERILSDDSKCNREEDEVPSWLCCTRYRPPKLSRASSSRTRRSGRHARVPFTAAQASALEAAYARAPYLAPPALRALAAALQLRDDRIKIWFQNRRARERREKQVNITPPDTVTLPATALPQILIPTHPWLHTATSYYNSQMNGLNSFTREEILDDSRSSTDSQMSNSFTVPDTLEVNSDESRPETPLDVET